MFSNCKQWRALCIMMFNIFLILSMIFLYHRMGVSWDTLPGDTDYIIMFRCGPTGWIFVVRFGRGIYSPVVNFYPW